MPLLQGASNIGKNIRELTAHGSRPRSKKQILAIALHTAYGDKKPTLQSLAGKKKPK